MPDEIVDAQFDNSHPRVTSKVAIQGQGPNRNGHERLIPSRLTSFNYLYVLVSCDEGTSIASFEVAPGFGFRGVKITKKRFSYEYTATWADVIQSTVRVTGQKMWQGWTKWRGQRPKPPGKKFFWKRASGLVNIIDWDDLRPGGYTNCTTNGPRSWWAHQCRVTISDPVYLPLCNRSF